MLGLDQWEPSLAIFLPCRLPPGGDEALRSAVEAQDGLLLLSAPQEAAETEAEADTVAAVAGRGPSGGHHSDWRVGGERPGQLPVLQHQPSLQHVALHTNHSPGQIQPSVSPNAETFLNASLPEVLLSRGPQVPRNSEVQQRVSLQHVPQRDPPEVALPLPLPGPLLPPRPAAGHDHPQVPEVPQISQVSVTSSSPLGSDQRPERSGEDGQHGSAGQQEEQVQADTQGGAEDLKLPRTSR